MDKILEQANFLSNLIKDSNEYSEYNKYKDIINNRVDLKDKLKELKKIELEIYLNKVNGTDINFDEEKKLSHRFSELLIVDETRNFLESEKNLLEIITKTQSIISDTFESELI
jgi:cell fate (sporulation/competence/biofilm development) regulator YlbF (YheA/YmcA/DUF963 family)